MRDSDNRKMTRQGKPPEIFLLPELIEAINDRQGFANVKTHTGRTWAEEMESFRQSILAINKGEAIPDRMLGRIKEWLSFLVLAAEPGLLQSYPAYVSFQESLDRGEKIFRLVFPSGFRTYALVADFDDEEESAIHSLARAAFLLVQYAKDMFQKMQREAGRTKSAKKIDAAAKHAAWILACPHCDRIFIRTRKGQKACSRKCSRYVSFDAHYKPGTDRRRKHEAEKKRRQREAKRNKRPPDQQKK